MAAAYGCDEIDYVDPLKLRVCVLENWQGYRVLALVPSPLVAGALATGGWWLRLRRRLCRSPKTLAAHRRVRGN